MKLTCDRAALLAALRAAEPARASRTTKPILGMVLLRALDDRLTIEATDREVGVRTEVRGVTSDRGGAVAVDPTPLMAILRESSDETVHLTYADDVLSVVAGIDEYDLPTADPNEFPELPEFDATALCHEVTAGVLRTLIKRAVFAADKDGGSRFATAGVLWEAEKGKLRLVASDLHRLSVAEASATITGETDPKGQSHLVPLKAIRLLERNLADDGELVRVALKPNSAAFQTERALIHTLLVEGRFPPWRNIIPRKLDAKFAIPTEAMLAAVRKASITADAESRRVEFAFTSGSLSLTAGGQGKGSSKVALALPDYTGPSIELAMDPEYVKTLLGVIQGAGEATLEIGKGDGERPPPAVFRLGAEYLHLIMPMVN